MDHRNKISLINAAFWALALWAFGASREVAIAVFVLSALVVRVAWERLVQSGAIEEVER